MFFLLQVDHGTDAIVKDCAGLIGVYNTYEAADDVMSHLFDSYQEDGDEGYCYYDDFDACIATRTNPDLHHWFIFDSDNPELIHY